MSTVISTVNRSGQVAHFTVDGDMDPRAQILRGRIARGELQEAKKSDTSGSVEVVVTDADTGVKDEKGDYLKSVHGGGIDPDAKGDALGQPSGSGATGKDATREVAEKYEERLETVETKVETKSTSKK